MKHQESDHYKWNVEPGGVCMTDDTGATKNIQREQGVLLPALKAAFPLTLPVFAGYWFLGLSYGIYMSVCGFGFVYPFLMALCIYGGSLEFVTVQMLMSPFAPVQTFITALMIQARHLFYGLAMLDKYKGLGKKKYYLIFAMSDETFSICCSTDIPERVDRGWFYFFISCLDQSYWVTGALVGGLLGSFISFNTEGLEFVMTAMFVAIFCDQWMKEKSHTTAYIGLAASAACVIFFGADNFLIPTMACILVLLTAFRRPIEKRMEQKQS